MRSLRWFFEEYLDAERAVTIAREMDKVLAQSVLMIKSSVLDIIRSGSFRNMPLKTIGILGSDIEFLSNWQPILLENNCSPRLTGHRDLEWETKFFNDIYGGIVDMKGIVNHRFLDQLNRIYQEIIARPEWSNLTLAQAYSIAMAEYELPLALKNGFRRIFPPIYQPELSDTFERFMDPITNLDKLSFDYTRLVLNNRPGLEGPYPTPNSAVIHGAVESPIDPLQEDII